MSLALDDLPRDPEWLLRQLQQMAEVVATERSRNIALEIERDTALTERDALRAEHDAAQAEIEKLRLLIRQLQRGRFGRRSEKLDADQLQLGLEDLEQTAAAAEAAQEVLSALAPASIACAESKPVGGQAASKVRSTATVLRRRSSRRRSAGTCW
jgi:hypothetical protein